jgi:hypothetical protein
MLGSERTNTKFAAVIEIIESVTPQQQERIALFWRVLDIQHIECFAKIYSLFPSGMSAPLLHALLHFICTAQLYVSTPHASYHNMSYAQLWHVSTDAAQGAVVLTRLLECCASLLPSLSMHDKTDRSEGTAGKTLKEELQQLDSVHVQVASAGEGVDRVRVMGEVLQLYLQCIDNSFPTPTLAAVLLHYCSFSISNYPLHTGTGLFETRSDRRCREGAAEGHRICYSGAASIQT